MQEFDVEVVEIQNQKYSVTYPLVENFLNASGFSENTKKNYRIRINSFLKYFNKNNDFNIINTTLEEMIEYKMYLISNDLKNTTIKYNFIAVKSFYNWLHSIKRINHNPTLGLKLPAIDELSYTCLTDKQIQQLFKETNRRSNAERNIAVFSLMLNGLRISEVINLNIEDYDGEKVHIKEAKNNSVGFVPLFDWVRNNLEEYLGERYALKYSNNEDPIFLNSKTLERITYRTISAYVEKINMKLDWHFNPHQCRHTFATNLLKQGMSANNVQTLMRHKSSDSLRRYTATVNYEVAEKEFRNLGN